MPSKRMFDVLPTRVGARAVDVRARHARENSLLQTIAQRGLPGRLGGALFDHPLRRTSEARRTRHVLRTRAHLALVRTAEEQRPQIHTLAHVERAHALGAVNLVSADRVQVDAEFLDVERDLACGLHAIGMEQNSSVASDSRNLMNRLDHAQLVIHVHHADQFRVGTDRRAHGFRVHHAACCPPERMSRTAIAPRLATRPDVPQWW